MMIISNSKKCQSPNVHIATQFVSNNTYILEEREDTRSTPRKDEGLYRGAPRPLQFMQGQTIFLWLTAITHGYLIIIIIRASS